MNKEFVGNQDQIITLWNFKKIILKKIFSLVKSININNIKKIKENIYGPWYFIKD